jgi:hypothetical protein
VEVGFVGELRHLVPVGGEDAFAARTLKRDAEAANAAKEVNETEFLLTAIHAIRRRFFLQLL